MSEKTMFEGYCNKCKRRLVVKMPICGEYECMGCGASYDTIDPKLLNKDGSVKEHTQRQWERNL